MRLCSIVNTITTSWDEEGGVKCGLSGLSEGLISAQHRITYLKKCCGFEIKKQVFNLLSVQIQIIQILTGLEF